MACGDFPECVACEHQHGDQAICDFCDDADQFEPEGEGVASNDAVAPFRKIRIPQVA